MARHQFLPGTRTRISFSGLLGSQRVEGKWDHPYLDFKTASMILDLPDTHPRTHNLEFGKDGKPLFISGPNDNPRAIVTTLQRTAGEGNFHYIAELSDPGEVAQIQKLFAERTGITDIDEEA